MKRWPLRNQLIFSMVFLVLVTLFATSVINAVLAGRRIREGINLQMQGVVDTLSGPPSIPMTETVLRQMSGLTGAGFAVVTPDGEIEATSFDSNPPIDNTSLSDEVRVNQASTSTVDGEPFYHLAVQLRRGPGDSESDEVLHIYYPQASYRSAIQDAVIPPLAVGGFVLLFGVFTSFQVASRVARPINTFRNQIDDLVHGDFRPISVPRRRDEIQDLVVAINHLAELLARYETEVRANERLRTLGQLGAGMAHQLRNSVTGCQLALDLHATECSLVEQESWRVANDQLKLMAEYLNRFLEAGRVHGAVHSEFRASEFVDEAIALTSPIASHSQVELTKSCEIAEDTMYGDRHALCQMLINVILNAIEAATRSSLQTGTSGTHPANVQVTLQSAGQGGCEIRVLDNGDGPSESISATLFDPLSTDKPEGTGLGLSVAKDIAKAHYGEITWNRTDEQTCFTIYLPLIGKNADGAHPDH